MGGRIARHRVFFDTNHLRYMASVVAGRPLGESLEPRRPAYRRLIEGMENGLIEPVVGFEQPYEWLSGGEMAGRELTVVLERAHRCWEVVPLTLGMRLEACRELARVSGSAASTPALLREFGERDEAVALAVGAVLRLTWEGSARQVADPADWLGMAISVQAGAEMNTSDWTAIARESALHANKIRQGGVQWQVERLREDDWLDMMLLSLGVHPAKRLWESLDLSRCPLLSLWVRFWWRYLRSTNGVVPENDAEDISYSPAWVYADACLIDRQMAGHVHAADGSLRGRVDANPERVLAFLASKPSSHEGA